ncbi:Hachiman antiphage defense system protein HamA [Salinivibrio sp. KP-1]|uniref:Hachiman antiphage defense system protein HamA n=1 Tax=Salinivibrio sp. KP-1 TaxID=1406902 RepID=UPI0006145E56|nr:Hachiman antiphage defense system protein HamA [Salinivibrio sp. KP-1]KKA43913.1 virulence associated protein [Salinivibrio sp. KP-1]
MPWNSTHTKWLVDTGDRLKTADGKEVEVWEFRHQNDRKMLSAWATHFRNHYCFDNEIDYWRKGYKYTRSEYLDQIKFPDPKAAPGPSIRAGDFSEVLVADFLEYLKGYWVPRTRYGDKTVRNESTKGSDIIGFHIVKDGKFSSDDKLAIYEAKAQFSGKKPSARLQDAVNDSAKDITRKAESLNAIKQRLYNRSELDEASKIERFQNEVDHPYKEVYGAVALFDNPLFDGNLTSSTNATSHPYSANLALVVIKGDQMMALVHELYRRAADEA